jgi:hypothetical protein
MSTLKTTNLQAPSAASPAFVLASDGTATAQLSSLNGGQLAGSRNRIINGSFEISQRGTSSASGGYLLDRWAATTVSAQSQSSDAPSGFINSIEFTSSIASYPYIEHRIERINSYDFAGQTATFSFWAKNVSGTSNLYVEVYRANANDNFSSITQENSGGTVVVAASPSSSWTRYTGTVTFSASATTGIALRIVRNNASAASTRITGVQLELGSVTTPFERRSYGQELALCQRYYIQDTSFPVSLYPPTSVATARRVTVGFPVTMRATPTITCPVSNIPSPTIVATTYGFRVNGTPGTDVECVFNSGYKADIEL